MPSPLPQLGEKILVGEVKVYGENELTHDAISTSHYKVVLRQPNKRVRGARKALQSEALALTRMLRDVDKEKAWNYVLPFYGCVQDSHTLVMGAYDCDLTDFVERALLEKWMEPHDTCPIVGTKFFLDLGRSLVTAMMWWHRNLGRRHGAISPATCMVVGVRTAISNAPLGGNKPNNVSSGLEIRLGGSGMERSVRARHADKLTDDEIAYLAHDHMGRHSADVWSAAATLAFVATGFRPYDGLARAELVQQVGRGRLLEHLQRKTQRLSNGSTAERALGDILRARRGSDVKRSYKWAADLLQLIRENQGRAEKEKRTDWDEPDSVDSDTSESTSTSDSYESDSSDSSEAESAPARLSTVHESDEERAVRENLENERGDLSKDDKLVQEQAVVLLKESVPLNVDGHDKDDHSDDARDADAKDEGETVSEKDVADVKEEDIGSKDTVAENKSSTAAKASHSKGKEKEASAVNAADSPDTDALALVKLTDASEADGQAEEDVDAGKSKEMTGGK